MMDRAEAVDLLEQAINRIKKSSPNGNGGSEQIGGIYWRLAKVLSEYADVQLET